MKTITGTWVDPGGNAIAFGIISLKLNQDATVVSTNQIAPRIIQFTLTSAGAIPANTQIWANDEISPNGTFYALTIMEQGGGVIYGPEYFTIAGASPININTLVPTGSGTGGTTSINFADSVQFVSANQTLSFLGAFNTLVNATAGAGGITLTLPSAVGLAGQTMRIVMVDTGVGGVNINTTAGQTISGRANYALSNQWQYVQVESNNANWIIVANN